MAILVVAGATAGYVFLEGWSVLDSLYMTVITVTTVGFGEVHPLSHQGRIMTIVVTMVGVGTVLYILGMLTQLVVEGRLREMMGRRSMQRKIRSLKDHYIICGFGRIGSLVYDMLQASGLEILVIDSSEEALARLEEEGGNFILGSATEDEVLLDAGLERARGLVATVQSDADNVYIVLTAKGIRPDLYVVARSTEAGSERKLKRAGADKVVSPYLIGAQRMAQTVIRPTVADFVELTFLNTHKALQMEELKVGSHTELAGVSLKDSGLRQRLDLIIMAVRKPDGEMVFNPPADTVIQVSDTLIALGPSPSMNKLAKILGSPQRPGAAKRNQLTP